MYSLCYPGYSVEEYTCAGGKNPWQVVDHAVKSKRKEKKETPNPAETTQRVMGVPVHNA